MYLPEALQEYECGVVEGWSNEGIHLVHIAAKPAERTSVLFALCAETKHKFILLLQNNIYVYTKLTLHMIFLSKCYRQRIGILYSFIY